MTRSEVVLWLEANDCEQEPLQGINVTGNAIKFVHKKNGRYVYIDTPIDDKPVPEFFIAHICTEMLIPSPDCALDQKPLIEDIKKRFSPAFLINRK